MTKIVINIQARTAVILVKLCYLMNGGEHTVTSESRVIFVRHTSRNFWNCDV
jgi:hypothetical protein